MNYISIFVVASTIFAMIVIWSLAEFISQRKKEKIPESQNG